MSDKPKRRFQLHLSTLIVLSFVAGGLVWANMPHYFPADSFFSSYDMRQGWPLVFRSNVLFWDDPFLETKNFSGFSLLMDCFVWLAILVAVAYAYEWRIHLREACKP